MMSPAPSFAPIAIVGQGCVLPGALSPDELWSLVLEGRSAIAPAADDLWRIDAGADRAQLHREIASTVGGHVKGFERVFDHNGFAVPADTLRGLDPVFLWTLHAAREALRSAGMSLHEARPRAALVLGNLSYPTPGLVNFALEQWAADPTRTSHEDPRNRYMSGFPAHLAAQALGFGGRAFAIDAACASSLYAIKLACDQLHDGSADLALAGGVNHADDLFLHGGFSALNALSPTGQSRPFHRDADGLVPAQGAALLVLERLDDALANGRQILGLIRGVGLSNDGRSRGLMVPAEEGQVRALRAAYAESGVSPRDISLVECHATGTVVGDGAEVRSMREVFTEARALPVGSLKSNVGHLITASGAAAVIKVLAAMRHQVRPPTRTAEAPIDELADGMFRLLRDAEPWEAPAGGAPRRAAISNFGFGGNNAHLILEEWTNMVPAASARVTPVAQVAASGGAIAVIAQSVRTGATGTRFTDAVFNIGAAADGALARGATTDTIALDAAGLRFPPNDLKATLPQQTLLLSMAQEMTAVLDRLPRERTSVLMGMQCDAEVARHAIRWCGARPWVAALPASLANDPLTAASVVGCMPNIVANRLSHQFDFRGPSYTVSSEELSGIGALDIGARALRMGEIDAAVVGAVDLCAEPIAEAAAHAVLGGTRAVPGDAAVLLVLKREADAMRDGDTILALLDADGADQSVPPTLTFALTDTNAGLTPRVGHAHAASGLLHVAAAIEACAARAVPSAMGPMPWLPRDGARVAEVQVEALGQQSRTLAVRAAATPTATAALFPTSQPRLAVFAANTVAALLDALTRRDECTDRSDAADVVTGVRLAIVAESDAEFETRVERAITVLRAPATAAAVGTIDDGIHVGRGALDGELSFVFTGAAGAYPHMGRDLALAFPTLVDGFAARANSVRDVAGWVYLDDPTLQSTPMDKLWGASYLSQLHAELTRHLLGLRPTAAIGYCSGETNSLFALDAWGDLDNFRDEVANSRVYDRWLCGELRCLRPAWNLTEDAPAEWSTWRIRAPVAEVQAAAASEARAHLVIINSPTDVVVAGDPQACERIGVIFGRRAVRTPGYDFVMHCPEAHEYESRWRAMHTRPTVDVPGVRFYTHATRSSYQATTQTAADALTGQAMHVVDFPALVERAYADGIRVFIEHGPHAGCTKWITDVLGDRPHVAIALDRYGHSSLLLAVDAAARLFAAGVPVELDAMRTTLRTSLRGANAALPRSPGGRSLPLSLPAHPIAVLRMPNVSPVHSPVPIVPTPAASHDAHSGTHAGAWNGASHGTANGARNGAHNGSSHGAGEYMAPAPRLASARFAALGASPVMAAPVSTLQVAPAATAVLVAAAPAPAPAPHAVAPQIAENGTNTSPFIAAVNSLAGHHAQLAALHTAFLRQQFDVQSRFTNLMLAPLAQWATGHVGAEALRGSVEVVAAPQVLATPVAHVALVTSVVAPVPSPVIRVPIAAAPAPVAAAPTPTPTPPATAPKAPLVRRVPPPRTPTGPTFDRAALEIHAGGAISQIFGPLFAQQDMHARQVRMPQPPLLLADRVLGIEGEAGTMGTGTIWTETDVRESAFYLHEGRMPAGVMVESGQADLMLISWLGADFHNQGARVYRLLGCELMSHGPLPTIGDTLHYEILVDGHAEQQGVRLFFFHYNCWVNGELRMSVRSGQAGFFTNEELANSAGVLWSAEAATPKRDARVDAPLTLTTRRAFSADDVTALIEGRVADCYGAGFDRADAHTRTPTIAGGGMRLLDEVTHFDPTGGPWKRGYLRATLGLTPDRWFFDGHFKNDPCMPGTLMLEGGLQAMQIFMTGLGFTLDHDGSRFEPVPEQNYSLRCRGQATPASSEVVYEIFVEEIVGGDTPTLYADILGSVDGRKAFHCKRMGLRLVPAWPLDAGRTAVAIAHDPRPVAVVDGFTFDYASLLACAWGVPSSAFGPMYKRFDGTRRVARLPGPPYHFMSRVARVSGPIGGMQVGSVAEIEYDVPPTEWYFANNNAPAMPFPVLLETALQPCGWLASYVGGALASEENLYFRNLDGTGTQHMEIGPDIGTVSVSTTLTSVSKADSIVIMSFDVIMRAGDRTVYTLKTVFGFFPGDTMKDQAGLPMTPAHRARLVDASDVRVELGASPAHYFNASLRLPTERLAMIDRITGRWTEGELAGKAGLGRLRAEKDVAASQWFFKAHFYQDPVQPGSLGIEALLQAVQALAIDLDLGAGLSAPRFETQAVDVPMSWKYRGQVIPDNHVVVADVEITEIRREAQGVLVVASGSLWVDGKRIYEAKGLGVRIVSVASA
ncbi:beta-ketoacyl synthase N-terminal-like domain-containing protein [Gemmatimonas sp.]|uniref:beta-ketoacyl synthase N-terminal-like domain-containing protein n=1 Tax=Gemmatimonas sp. TaxID=1962908 RepID=UPI00356A7232